VDKEDVGVAIDVMSRLLALLAQEGQLNRPAETPQENRP